MHDQIPREDVRVGNCSPDHGQKGLNRLFPECRREPSRMVFERWGGPPDGLYRSGTPRGDPVEIGSAAERAWLGLRALGR